MQIIGLDDHKYFPTLWEPMKPFKENSRATICSLAVFFFQQSEQDASAERGSKVIFVT